MKHGLTEHIGVDSCCTRAQVQDGAVALTFVHLELLLADFFTKAQTRAQHTFYLSKISFLDPSLPPDRGRREGGEGGREGGSEAGAFTSFSTRA